MIDATRQLHRIEDDLDSGPEDWLIDDLLELESLLAKHMELARRFPPPE